MNFDMKRVLKGAMSQSSSTSNLPSSTPDENPTTEPALTKSASFAPNTGGPSLLRPGTGNANPLSRTSSAFGAEGFSRPQTTTFGNTLGEGDMSINLNDTSLLEIQKPTTINPLTLELPDELPDPYSLNPSISPRDKLSYVDDKKSWKGYNKLHMDNPGLGRFMMLLELAIFDKKPADIVAFIQNDFLSDTNQIKIRRELQEAKEFKYKGIAMDSSVSQVESSTTSASSILRGNGRGGTGNRSAGGGLRASMASRGSMPSIASSSGKFGEADGSGDEGEDDSTMGSFKTTNTKSLKR